MLKNISARDLELLSSYLDNQLSPSELKHLQARLVLEEGLQSALQGLQRTKLILKALPPHPVPRDFSIALEQKRSRFDLYQYFQAFRFSAVGAVLVLMILLVMDFFLPSLKMAAPPTGLSMQAPAAVVLSEPSVDEPVIITWESPQAETFGRGGVGGGAAEPSGTDVTPQAAPLENAKKAPDEALTAPVPETAVLPELETAPPVSGTGPILGIPPSAQRGVVPTLSPMPVEMDAASFDALRLLQIGFGLLAVLAAILALWIRRRMG